MSEATREHSCPVADWYQPLSPEQLRDPYPVYARTRREAPVAYSESLGMWLVTRYDDVAVASTDYERFSSLDAMGAAVPLYIFERMPPDLPADVSTLIQVDPPAHTRVRRILNQAFNPRAVASREPEIRAIVDELIDSFASVGTVEMMSEFATPLPVRVILGVLGLPQDDWPTLKAWSDGAVAAFASTNDADTQAEIAKTFIDFRRYAAEVVDGQRPRHADGLLTAMIDAVDPESGERLDPLELRALFVQLVIAGSETTTNLIGNMVAHLLEHPTQLAAVTADPSLVSAAVEETLRYDSPVQGLFRVTTQDVELGGARIPAGARVQVLWGSANRDGDHFERPDEFDILRADARTHLGFGKGTHFCLGAALARLEARVALERLVARLPGLRRAGPEGLRVLPSPVMRGLERLDLAFDPSG